MKPPKIPSLISVIILTTITLVFWVMFEVLRAFISKPEASVPAAITEPLTPSLDAKTIDKMEKRIFFEEGQIPQIQATSIPTPLPTQLPTTIPTSSVFPSTSPTPTPSL